ncbi:MAG: copper chaperone PCu(A)C [Chloroflexota bacterium]
MPGKVAFLLAAVLFALSPLAALAQDGADCDATLLLQAWARSSPGGAPNGAVFGLLVNLGDEADTLTGVTSTVAEVVELHETRLGDGDMMQMHPVEVGFVVPPRGYLSLEPGGLHMMLIGLTQPLLAGESFDLTLQFERQGEVVVSVPIVDVTAMDGPAELPPAGEMSEAEATPEAVVAAWPEACEGVHVLDAWARPAGAGMPNSAAYGLVVNLTPFEERIVAAASDAAMAVELHEMTLDDNDVMRMRPVEGGIRVPAGGVALLQPGGLHVMLIGLNEPLMAGETLDLTLEFSHAGETPLQVPVREPEEPMMDMGASGHH